VVAAVDDRNPEVADGTVQAVADRTFALPLRYVAVRHCVSSRSAPYLSALGSGGCRCRTDSLRPRGGAALAPGQKPCRSLRASIRCSRYRIHRSAPSTRCSRAARGLDSAPRASFTNVLATRQAADASYRLL